MITYTTPPPQPPGDVFLSAKPVLSRQQSEAPPASHTLATHRGPTGLGAATGPLSYSSGPQEKGPCKPFPWGSSRGMGGPLS